jgi:hypothetical protein
MPETQIGRIELTGWKAIAALVLILGVTGIRVSSRIQTVSNDGREALREWLVKDYSGRGPKALAQRVAAYRQGVSDALDIPAVPDPNIDFAAVTAHGSADAMIVRTEISVDGGPPPDDHRVRYLFLTTRVGGGWMVLSESEELTYYEILFNFGSRHSWN